MFSDKNYVFFLIAFVLLLIGFIVMVIDPVENGFGFLTLWLAPPLLLTGFALPVLGIIGWNDFKNNFLIQRGKEKKWKHAIGFAVFLTSFLVYILTLEPTASLWDCAEFIAAAFKLQVPHTPGTPLSLLIGRLFTMLSFGDVYKVAWTLNMMSGFFSALTVYLVYYIIFYFGKKVISPSIKNSNRILIISSLCGSLCLAFSDTFWFSAVEAEIYGLACFFMAFMLWIILKANTFAAPLRSRCLILIAYLAGLSYCIHPMCLLVVPVLPLLWYASDKEVPYKTILLLGFTGLLIVFMINRFVAVGLFEAAFFFDLFFVNSLHLPFYSGSITLVAVLGFVFMFLIRRYKHYAAFTWSVAFLLPGFLPYLLLFIRSNHNPPIDETNPENLALIKAYMNRESYPSSPLLYGPYFDANIDDVTIKKKAYYRDEETYKAAGNLIEYHYENSRQTILPRLYSHDASHIEAYRFWTGLKPNEKPRFIHNITFLLKYQLGHMYFRYLMWNFSGRESDVQNSGWLKPWDTFRFHSPSERARNQYWMLPLLLGIVGFYYQFNRDKKSFAVNAIFFLVTGIILALYLNSTPNEPRERDYIYVGSWVAFSIWIGLGISGLAAWRSPFWLVALISFSVPAWMLYQNYDDHNRSGRTFQMDYARNILNSCAPNSILFTGGDNDTFPLWYLQEVESVRTDVRVVVLSYFNTDWYINQLRKPYYRSASFKLSLSKDDYRQYGLNDVLYLDESVKEGIDVEKYLRLLQSDHPALKITGNNGEPYHIVPSRILKIKMKGNITNINKETEGMILKIKGNYLEKNALAVLDLLISNQWERPMYFNYTSTNTFGLDIKPYVVQEGSVFRLSPYKNRNEGIAVNSELAYRNLIENADYKNLADDKVYFNSEDYQARMVVPLRQCFNDLAEAFIKKGDQYSAEEVLQHALMNLYHRHLKPSFADMQTIDLLFAAGREDLAQSLSSQIFDHYYAQINASQIKMDRLDNYLFRQSARILYELEDARYLSKIKTLDLDF